MPADEMLLKSLTTAEDPATQATRGLALVHAHVTEERRLRVERFLALGADTVDGWRTVTSAAAAGAPDHTCRRGERKDVRWHLQEESRT